MPCNTPPPPMMDDMQDEIEDAPVLLNYEDEEEEIIEIVENDDSDLSYEAHNDAVFCCNFDKNGILAVSGGQDEKACVWNTNTGDTKFTCTGHKDSIIAADFNYDSSLVATAGMDGIIQVWNVESGTKVWDFETTEISWMAWHPSSNLLFAATGDGNCWKWSVPDGTTCEVFPTHGVGASCGHIFSNGTKCLIGYMDGSIKLWDIEKVSVIGSITGHTDNITCVTSSADGNLIASGSEDGNCKLIKTSNCRVLHTWNFPPNDMHDKETVEAIGFFKNYPLVAIGTSNGVLSIFDISTYTLRTTVNVEAPIVKLICADASPLVYIAAGGEIQAYDGRSGQLEKKWDGHALSILDLVFSPNREKFLTASDDFTCKVFTT